MGACAGFACDSNAQQRTPTADEATIMVRVWTLQSLSGYEAALMLGE